MDNFIALSDEEWKFLASGQVIRGEPRYLWVEDGHIVLSRTPPNAPKDKEKGSDK